VNGTGAFRSRYRASRKGCRVQGVLSARVRVTRREPVLVGAAKPASSVSRSRRLNENRTSEKAAQIGTIRQAEQRWSLVNAVVPPGTLIYAEKVRPQFLPLRHLILKYKVNLCFSMVDSRIASGRDGVLEASVIRSEIRSRAQLNSTLPLFLHLHTNELPRKDPLVKVDYVRVVDLDIGEQIGHLRDQSGHHFRARRQNSSLQPRVHHTTDLPRVRRGWCETRPTLVRRVTRTRARPTRLLRPIRLRRIADGNEECRDLIIAETKLT
jgi:hypothetical protein